MKERIAFIGGLTALSGLEAAFASALTGKDVEIVDIDQVKDNLRREAYIKHTAPEVTAVATSYPQKKKKDKSGVKRYSSYFNKLKSK